MTITVIIFIFISYVVVAVEPLSPVVREPRIDLSFGFYPQLAYLESGSRNFLPRLCPAQSCLSVEEELELVLPRFYQMDLLSQRLFRCCQDSLLLRMSRAAEKRRNQKKG